MKADLVHSGLPITRDDESELLCFGEGLTCGGYSRKTAVEMGSLLYDQSGRNAEDTVYDVYRDIVFERDRPLFASDRYRYDITYIMPGLVGDECKKTSGHYHCYNPKRSYTYPEVYEVLHGTALYVLQKSSNFENRDEETKIDDLILVKVEAGQTLLVPPGYGHCSINIGDGPMIFSNLAYVPCGIDYGPVKQHHGMSMFARRVDGNLVLEPNRSYADLPQARFAVVKESPKFGIEFGKPVYESYIKRPEAFRFLGDVDPYADEIMEMLEYRGENWA